MELSVNRVLISLGKFDLDGGGSFYFFFRVFEDV